jgi:hypothetical protein
MTDNTPYRLCPTQLNPELLDMTGQTSVSGIPIATSRSWAQP